MAKWKQGVEARDFKDSSVAIEAPRMLTGHCAIEPRVRGSQDNPRHHSSRSESVISAESPRVRRAGEEENIAPYAQKMSRSTRVGERPLSSTENATRVMSETLIFLPRQVSPQDRGGSYTVCTVPGC